ncbi:MAG: 5'-methylthioadenosine/S-adenosylhomocysteine nucleosidase [Aliihoeflea sp.]|uniref:5'-methylthioadenosine/S-adenosylhomocysteine nucleosidase n=1 Tax=Aliihoeflea sp. TaxID=2608088 RepID=UPI00403432CF
MIRNTLIALAATTVAAAAQTATPVDQTARTAVISAFQPEWTLLQEMIEDREDHLINGTAFITGTLEDKPVVLFLSGVSMVNAAMTTQMALDHFEIENIVFSGIAGGVDPALTVGDVVVAEEWSQYLEAVFARETDGAFATPSFLPTELPNYGMIFPRPVDVARGEDGIEERQWFSVDAALLKTARKVAEEIELQDCVDQTCLSKAPSVIVGGKGVSGQAFVDNADFREYVFETFDAQVLDMESAAVAHVAYANEVPFIAFRSLSDLAGGGESENEMGTFMQVASDNSAAVVKAFIAALSE